MANPQESCAFDHDRLVVRFELTIAGSVKAIEPAVQQILTIVGSMGCARGKEFAIETAIREALANAITHGCGSDASKQVKIFGLDSGGNWSEGTFSKQGPKLVGATSGSFADGRRVEYKWEVTFQDNENTRIETGATILGGVRNEFRDTYKRVAN